jgi:hypothetical protein
MDNDNASMAVFTKFLQENGWRYLTDEDGAVRGLFSGDDVHRHWYAHLNGDGRFLVFKSFCPVNVSARRRPAAAEYLMRANWGLNFGNFEMDWSDGQVCFRTSVTTLDESALSTEALGNLVYINHSTMTRYLPGLLAVTCGSAKPSRAISEAEADLQPPTEAGEQNGTAPADGNAGSTPRAGKKPRRFSANDN